MDVVCLSACFPKCFVLFCFCFCMHSWFAKTQIIFLMYHSNLLKHSNFMRWSHEGCDSLRMVATSYRKWTQITRTSCIFGHTCETSLRLIYHLSQVNVRRPCDGRNWSYRYIPLTASDRKNVCHRPHASLPSPAAYMWHMCDHPRSA